MGYRNGGAALLYDALINDTRTQCGGEPPETTLALIRDIATLEDVRIDCEMDIASKGVIELFVQGRQRIRRENKCVALLCRLSTDQARLLKALRAASAAAAAPEDDSDDTFGQFD